jgi:PadR family transcriptional regulator PadR
VPVSRPNEALSPTDFHVLLVLAGSDLYGYAILKAVSEESAGRVKPEIGSLYRVLARLMSLGYVVEIDPPADAPEIHRGRPRRYYRITPPGRELLASEAKRLETALRLARKRAAGASGGSRS